MLLTLFSCALDHAYPQGTLNGAIASRYAFDKVIISNPNGERILDYKIGTKIQISKSTCKNKI